MLPVRLEVWPWAVDWRGGVVSVVRGRGLTWALLAFWILLGAWPLAASSAYPWRVVSLGPSLTEEVYLLGAGERLVGCTVYCRKPPEAMKKEKVGTVVEVDVERILALDPDLVLATSLTDLRDVKKLKGLGIRVEIFPQPKSFDDLCQQFLRLGRLLGEEGRAREVVARVRAQVEKIRASVRGLDRPKVFVEIGSRPLFTVTRGSFINDFIEMAGGINIAAGAKSGLYSREKVLEQDPDVILIVTMGIVGERERKTWEKFKTIKAVMGGRIYVVDSYELCSPTPVTFVKFLRHLVKLLHPELAEKVGR